MEYVVTIDAVNINTSSPKTFYFSGGVGFTSSPSSSPANMFFDPRLDRPYEARRDMFDKSTTYGAVSMGAGEIALVISSIFGGVFSLRIRLMLLFRLILS